MNRLSGYLRASVQDHFANLMDRQGLLGLVDANYRKRIPGPRYTGSVIDHVNRLALFVLRKQTDWLAAVELTGYLRTLDEDDPVKYDFALFGLGVIDKF